MNVNENEADWGPAMAALTERQRRYVMEMAIDPFGNPSRWAKAAGYPETAAGNNRVMGWALKRNPKVAAAIFEFARMHLFTDGPILAVAGLLKIASDEAHPRQFQALESLANRVGLHETTEHTVRVEHSDVTGAALIERIRQLAVKHGLDPERLIGPNVSRETSPQGKQIEAEVIEEVRDEQR